MEDFMKELQKLLKNYYEVSRAKKLLEKKEKDLKSDIKKIMCDNKWQKQEIICNKNIFSLVISSVANEKINKEKLKEYLSELQYNEVVEDSPYDKFCINIRS